MGTDVNFWFSSAQLAALGAEKIIDIPRSERRAGEKALKLKWMSRDVPGSGGKGGMRTEYQPPADVLALIQPFLEANPGFFKPKRGKAVAPVKSDSPSLFWDDDNKKPFEKVVHQPAAAPYGFILVPRYDVSASMGNGTVIHSEQVVDHLAFREEWVRTELSANPKNLVLISAIGDSMEPTLRAGDLLLIDRSGTGVKQDAIYAFATNGELRVKRMQLKIDGSVVVKSDNPQYEAETLSANQVETLMIVGRVVWSGRRM